MQNEAATIQPSGNVSYYPPVNPPPYDGPPGQPGPPYMGPTVVQATVVPATIITQRLVGSQPSTIVCKSCNMQIVTRVEFKPSLRTHLMALLLCVFGCWPCACVPYCMDSCNNIDHYCPNCGAYIGSYMN